MNAEMETGMQAEGSESPGGWEPGAGNSQKILPERHFEPSAVIVARD